MVSRCVCQSAPVRALVVPVCCERGPLRILFLWATFSVTPLSVAAGVVAALPGDPGARLRRRNLSAPVVKRRCIEDKGAVPRAIRNAHVHTRRSLRRIPAHGWHGRDHVVRGSDCMSEGKRRRQATRQLAACACDEKQYQFFINISIGFDYSVFLW